MSAPVASPPEDLQAESLARDIASDMPSPYCPGRSIASCPSDAARVLEDDILDLAKQGMDREQIETVLVERFGEDKMGQDAQSEVLVAILLGAALALAAIVWLSRRWLSRPASSSASETNATSLTNEASPDELDRLEDELDEIDGI